MIFQVKEVVVAYSLKYDPPIGLYPGEIEIHDEIDWNNGPILLLIDEAKQLIIDLQQMLDRIEGDSYVETN